MKIFLLLLVLSFPSIVLAQESSSPQPFETHMNMGFLGIIGGSMDYRIGDEKITRYEDFKSRIYPLRDEECSGLIRDAETSHTAAMIFYLGGVALGADIALSYQPNVLFHNDFIDRVLTGLIGLQLLGAVGSLFDANAEGGKYNAVQRYNRLIRRPKESVWRLAPQWAPTDQRLDLAFSRSF